MNERQISTSTTQRAGPREHVLNVMDEPRRAGDNDRVRAAHRAREQVGYAEAADGEHLLESFPEARRGGGVVVLEASGDALRDALASSPVGVVERLGKAAVGHLREVVGKVVANVAPLVENTPLDDGVLAEYSLHAGG